MQFSSVLSMAVWLLNACQHWMRETKYGLRWRWNASQSVMDSPWVQRNRRKKKGVGGCCTGVTLTVISKRRGAHRWGGVEFPGKVIHKIELITIWTLSEMDYLISCIAFRYISMAWGYRDKWQWILDLMTGFTRCRYYNYSLLQQLTYWTPSERRLCCESFWRISH
jgi:hypothetical protein